MSKKATEKSITSKKPFYTFIFIVAAVLVVALALLAQRYYANLNQQLFDERRDHLVEFAGQSAELISKSNDYAVDQLNACAFAFSQENTQSGADVNRCLEYMSGLVSSEDTLVILFDEKGNYYSSDGARGYWQESALLQDTGRDVNTEVMSCPHEGSVIRMIYAKRLENGVTIPGADGAVTHIAIAINSDEFKRELSVTAYGDTCYTYLTNKNGRRIYQYSYDNESFLGGYNLLHAIEQCGILHKGEYDSLSAAIEAHGTDAYEFTYVDSETGNKSEWFVALAYIDNADWIVLLLVPTASVGAGTASLLSGTAAFFAAIAAALLMIFGIVILIVMKNKADQRLLAQQEENNELLREAAEKAEAASRAKTQFLSHMSHDIRTPINGIMGMTDIALKNIGNDEKTKDCLQKIDGASQHLLSLVNDVLDLSRIESGKTTLNNDPFSLKKCLENCASIISGQLVNREINLVCDFGGITAPAVMGDELHLRQIFINILGNSVKFTPDGGTITFRATEGEEKDGKRIFIFDLSDTGIGMSPEFLPKIFESFSQEAGGSRTTYKGTGLGMAITKSFVDMMGGTIQVESELNKGTDFLVSIPMEVRLQDGAEEADTTVDYETLKGIKILLAEDNELNAEIAIELLGDAGIEAQLAVNGREAVEAFEKSEPGELKAILMDVMMPEMNGLEAARAIRQLSRPDAAKIPIIALSANAYDEDIKMAKEAGMNDHLAKPIDTDALFRTLARYTV